MYSKAYIGGSGPDWITTFPLVFVCCRLDLLPGTPDVSQLGTLQDPSTFQCIFKETNPMSPINVQFLVPPIVSNSQIHLNQEPTSFCKSRLRLCYCLLRDAHCFTRCVNSTHKPTKLKVNIQASAPFKLALVVISRQNFFKVTFLTLPSGCFLYVAGQAK